MMLQANTLYTIEVKGDNFTPLVKLLAADGREIQQARGGVAGDARLAYRAESSQRALLQITSLNKKAGPITITISR
jgi:hypothetical protein